jgi:FkbM family methyltransferase
MSGLSRKFRRLQEAWHVSMLGADVRSKARLARCFALLGRTVTDPTEIDLVLRPFGSPIRIRRSDVFTLMEIFYEGQYEHRVTVPARPMIVDAGANVGIATLWLLGRYPDATIHAFEPGSGNHRLLARNLEPYPRVFAYRSALGSRDGEVDLTLSQHGAMHSTSVTAEARIAGARTERVRCRTLAGFMAEHAIEKIDFLKLDVEGAELEVVEGLGDRIADVRAIVGEVHERMVDPDAFYARLEAAGYRTRRMVFLEGDEGGVHGFEAQRSD